MVAQRLTERVASPFAGSAVDKAAGVVRNVLLCGTDSANGRTYPWTGPLKAGIPLYEGRPVNCDHAGTATVDRRIGWLSNPKPGPDGRPRADLHLLTTHPLTPRILEAAERNPSLFGLSHVAMCRTSRVNGVEVVEAIEAIESVDLVADPATTKGLYESKGTAVGKISLKTFIERCGPKWGAKRWAAATKLCEDMGPPADVPVMDEPPTDMPDGDLKTALIAAITPMLEEAFESGNAEKVCSAVKDFVKLHAKHTGKGDTGKGDTSTGDTSTDTASTPADEGKRVTLAGLIAEAKAGGIADPTAADLAVLEAIPSAAGRKAYCESVLSRVSSKGTERPVSGGKAPGAGPLPGKGGKVEESAPTDPKGFAAYIRE